MTARRTYHRLRDLLDVLVSSPADGQVLTYSSAAGKWENQAGGGGSQPVTRARYGSDVPLTLASGAAGFITWAKAAGDALLDLTDPATPTIVTAGLYAFEVTVSPDTDFTAGGGFRCQLSLDGADDTNNVTAMGNVIAGGVGDFPVISLSLTRYLPAGAQVTLSVTNYDVASQDFEMGNRSSVQRLA